MTRRTLLLIVALAVLALTLPSPVRAVSTKGTVHNVPYVIAFRPLNSQTHPYMGQMRLNFSNGIVSGTYTDESVRPGSPFANRVNVPVSGGISGEHVSLQIGTISFRGTMQGEEMSGSATIRGRIYTFSAKQGTPGHPMSE